MVPAHLFVKQTVGVLACVGITAQSLNIVVGLGILHEAVVSIDQLVGRSRLLHNNLCIRKSRCLVAHIKIDLHEFLISIEAVFFVLPIVECAFEIDKCGVVLELLVEIEAFGFVEACEVVVIYVVGLCYTEYAICLSEVVEVGVELADIQ